MQLLVVLIALLVFGVAIWLAIQIQQGAEGWFGAFFQGRNEGESDEVESPAPE